MKKLDFGGSKNQKKTKKWNEIGQMLVSGALDDTEKMRKLGADSFPKSPAWKNPKNRNIQKTLWIFLVFPVDFGLVRVLLG